ncbi:hypothetical protein BHE74_00052506 [Ensete ventricosum]|nr:hypothetical protein GW17_00014130 [Ensete ventricosum]RWW41974.1 hypothetical protein BHE74_00052506 [Ensete ventricosum]
MRKLKFHEKKLLKKVNFIEYKREGGHREALVTRRYHLTERDDYKKYIVFEYMQDGAEASARLEANGSQRPFPYRDDRCPAGKALRQLCCCRRRLATVLVYLKFAEHLREAVTYIEQGHIRVGPDVVTDPAFLVTRNMEDFVTWVDSSKIKRKVMEYNERLDDYDVLNA